MSDYSFLRTGTSNLIEPTKKMSDEEKENIEIILGLFTSNALINASKYVHECKRNAVTKTDVLYGLQYEVFEFFSRSNIDQGLAEIREEYEKLKQEQEEYEEEEDYEDEEDEYEEEETHTGVDLGSTELNEMIMNDTEVNDFSRIKSELINSNNREFVEKMHNYNDSWVTWEPQTDLEVILKNAIDKIN
jgi:activator of 2-hydroxyglutaryl-CoA dehydratase